MVTCCYGKVIVYFFIPVTMLALICFSSAMFVYSIGIHEYCSYQDDSNTLLTICTLVLWLCVVTSATIPALLS
jgi:hypothetical protein